jgi:regulator of replication initiation timing
MTDELATARAEIAALKEQVERLTKENVALEINCRDFNEAGLEAIRQRDAALSGAAFWERMSNANSDDADKLAARITRLTTVTDEDVERVAKAIFEDYHKGLLNCSTWDDLDDEHPHAREIYMRHARAALEAHTAKNDSK